MALEVPTDAYLHVWHSKHGEPSDHESVIRINNQIANQQDVGIDDVIADLLQVIINFEKETTITESIVLYERSEDKSVSCTDSSSEDSTWKDNPIATYASLYPKGIRIKLPRNSELLFPLVFVILNFSKQNQLVVVYAIDEYPSYWLPDSSSNKHSSIVANNGDRYWESISGLLKPINTSNASNSFGNPSNSVVQWSETRPVWALVNRKLKSIFDKENFTDWAQLGFANHYKTLQTGFVRDTESGPQSVIWRMSLIDVEDSSSPICCRLSTRLRMESVVDSIFEMDLLPGSTHIFECELSEFFEEASSDLGLDLFMANRDEWGSLSPRVSIEIPSNHASVEEAVRTHLIPFLNNCTTPINTLKLLKTSKYPFMNKKIGFGWLPDLILAWHFQDLDYYKKVKENFSREMISRVILDADQLENSLSILESIRPVYAV